jgi:Phosphatase
MDELERWDPWVPADYATDELAEALVEGRVAGPVTSHDRRNVLRKIRRLAEGDPDLQFGLRGMTDVPPATVLALMAEAAGFDPDPAIREGPSLIDPYRVLAACEAAGRRLAQAVGRGERVILATGHPAGLPLLYIAIGELLERGGAKLLRPHEGVRWDEQGEVLYPMGRHRHRQIRYLRGVAVLTDHASTLHTHDPGPMERMLAEDRPDLVFADHGFAGAAIQGGIETISIVDVNDPAPVVAKHQGRTELVIVMDDNVEPDAYWPCFQAIASQFR